MNFDVILNIFDLVQLEVISIQSKSTIHKMSHSNYDFHVKNSFRARDTSFGQIVTVSNVRRGFST